MLGAESPVSSANHLVPGRHTFLTSTRVTLLVSGLPPKLSLLPLGQQPSRWDFSRRVSQICILERPLWGLCEVGMKWGKVPGEPVKGVVGHGKDRTDQRFRRKWGQNVGVNLMG